MFEFEWFKQQKTLTMEHEKEINKFYALRYSENYPVFYHCSPQYNSAIGSNQFRYAVIDKDTDKIFIAFKIIQIMTTRQIRVFDRPISLIGNVDNEDWLIEQLKQKSFIKFAYKENTKGFNGNRLVEYDDYYIDFSMHKINMRYVHRFQSIPDLKLLIVNKLDSQQQKQLYDLRVLWSQYENASKLSLKEYNNLLHSNVPNIYHVITYYKNQIVHDKVIFVNDLGYANSVYEFGNRNVECDGIIKKILYHKLIDIRNYYIKCFLAKRGIKRLYIAGCRPTEKRMIQHKQQISDGVIKYYLDDANYLVQKISTKKKKLF